MSNCHIVGKLLHWLINVKTHGIDLLMWFYIFGLILLYLLNEKGAYEYTPILKLTVPML